MAKRIQADQFEVTTTPTTSASTYDILTRNTSTGVVEKVGSSVLNTLEQNKIITATSYTFQLSDAGNRVITNYTGNIQISFIIPTNASVPFPIGTVIKVSDLDMTNTFGYVLSGSGVTIRCSGSLLFKRGQTCTITKLNTDEWIVERESRFYWDGNSLNADGNITGSYIYGNFFLGALSNANSGRTIVPNLYNFTANSVHKYASDLSADYDNRTLPDKEYVDKNRLKSYTVSTLPTGVEGDTAYVTDATAPTYLGTLTGGGSVKCPVFFNGSAWVSH